LAVCKLKVFFIARYHHSVNGAVGLLQGVYSASNRHLQSLRSLSMVMRCASPSGGYAMLTHMDPRDRRAGFLG
jgi:hypothetical protein